MTARSVSLSLSLAFFYSLFAAHLVAHSTSSLPGMLSSAQMELSLMELIGAKNIEGPQPSERAHIVSSSSPTC